VGRAGASRDFPGRLSDAEVLWYSTERWADWVDGFARVLGCQGDWPRTGAVLDWESRPGGRGRVQERVSSYAPGVGQTVQVTDSRLAGIQTVAFEALDGGVSIELTLEYRLTPGGPAAVVMDLLFIRRAVADSLRRTLERFGRELAAQDAALR